MVKNLRAQVFERKVTGAERFFAHAPFATVTMVARIKGEVTQDLLVNAIQKVQQRHALLRVRIRDDKDGALWFTTDGAGDIPLEVVARRSGNDWIEIHSSRQRIPYEFETRPAIRFVLIQSKEVSELVILCHHMICDGMSLAYLTRDLMMYLGDPTAKTQQLPAPEPISMTNLPNGIAPSFLVKYFIGRIKRSWAVQYVNFDQTDYEALNEAYWDAYRHEIISIELSTKDTAALVNRCRQEKVTVNTALITAFLGGQNAVMAPQPHHAKTVSAVNLRNRLPISPAQGFGYYAHGLEVAHKYNPQKSMWENARSYHKKINSNSSDKKVFGDIPIFLAMDSNIYEALNFKKLGRLVNPDSARYEKLKLFSQREDVVVRLLKRAKMEKLEAKLMGPAITNLGRMNFPTNYGNLELDRLILQPGGAFPLVHVDMVIGAVTVAEKLSLVIEYAAEAVASETMEKIREKAMALLLEE